MSFEIEDPAELWGLSEKELAKWKVDIDLTPALSGKRTTQAMGAISYLKSTASEWEKAQPKRGKRLFLGQEAILTLSEDVLGSLDQDWLKLEYAGPPMPALGSRYLLDAEEAAARFSQLCEEWQRDTLFVSSTDEIISHHAYLKIIGMGLQAVPLILAKLPESSTLWFPALDSIAGYDAAEGATTANEAVERWVAWGAERNLLS